MIHSIVKRLRKPRRLLNLCRKFHYFHTYIGTAHFIRIEKFLFLQIVIDIVNKDFTKLIDYLNRQEALDILNQIQTHNVRHGRDEISLDEINAEISTYRNEKKVAL